MIAGSLNGRWRSSRHQRIFARMHAARITTWHRLRRPLSPATQCHQMPAPSSSDCRSPSFRWKKSSGKAASLPGRSPFDIFKTRQHEDKALRQAHNMITGYCHFRRRPAAAPAAPVIFEQMTTAYTAAMFAHCQLETADQENVNRRPVSMPTRQLAKLTPAPGGTRHGENRKVIERINHG